MSYTTLTLWHSGQSLFGGANPTRQYGDRNVAAKATLRHYLGCSDAAWRRVPPSGLPLPAPSPKQPGTATRAGAQGGVYGQSAALVDPGTAHPLPPGAAAPQPLGGSSIAAVVGPTPCPWPTLKPELLLDASCTTARTVTSQSSWLKSTSYWHPPRRRSRLAP